MQNYKYAGFDSMWNITRIELPTYLQSKCSHVDLNIEPRSCITAFTLDFTGSGFDIARTRWCELYLVTITEYNAHRIIDISAIETEIRWFEYFGVKMQNCSYVVFDRTTVDIGLIGCCWFNSVEMWSTRHIVLWHISNSNGDAWLWIFNNVYEKLQLRWICRWSKMAFVGISVAATENT